MPLELSCPRAPLLASVDICWSSVFSLGRLKDPEVKDVDFCHTPGLDHQLLATVGGDGSCQLWALQADAVLQVASLEVPKGGFGGGGGGR
jgi:hypothetical protein